MSDINYSRHGDYLLPDISIREPPRELTEPINRYGAMRRSFLKTHRPILYSALALSDRLYPHLRETQQNAHKRLDEVMSDMLALYPAPNKAADSLKWAAHMTEMRRAAEMAMLDEVVYA